MQDIPPKKPRDPKTRPLTVLLTEDQYAQAATLAERRGVGLSTLARALLVQEVARDEQDQQIKDAKHSRNYEGPHSCGEKTADCTCGKEYPGRPL